jgi:hypothetical protein
VPAQRTGLGDPGGGRTLCHPGFPLLGGGGLRGHAPLLPHVGGLLAELPYVGGNDGATAGPRSCSSLSTPTPSFSLSAASVSSLSPFLSWRGAPTTTRGEAAARRSAHRESAGFGVRGERMGRGVRFGVPRCWKKTPKLVHHSPPCAVAHGMALPGADSL